MKETIYMTAGSKKHLLKHSEEIKRSLERFRAGDFGTSSCRPHNELIKDFGSYQLSFGTLWIISYYLFSNRDFITLLLPEEYERGDCYETEKTTNRTGEKGHRKIQ